MLLTGKVRRRDEEEIIKDVLVKVFKRKIDTNSFFDGSLVSLDFFSMTVSNNKTKVFFNRTKFKFIINYSINTYHKS